MVERFIVFEKIFALKTSGFPATINNAMKIDISIVDHFLLYFGVKFEGCFIVPMKNLG